MSIVENEEGRGQLRGKNGKRILTGSMSLLTCIAYLALVDTHHLVVKQANLNVINDIKQVAMTNYYLSNSKPDVMSWFFKSSFPS